MMPVHNWTRVDSGIFHDFHQSWIISIRNVLNRGILPGDYYAMAEQVAEGPIPDVVTLERMSSSVDDEVRSNSTDLGSTAQKGVAVLETPPKTRFSHEADLELYAGRATNVVVRHVSGDRVVGYIEIVSPGNKHSAVAIKSFVDKLAKGIQSGCHLMVVDLHPPTPRDPRGIHAYFWQQYFGDEAAPGVDQQAPLGMAAYCSSHRPVAYFEPFAVGDALIDMPIFLTHDRYINVPLESSYNEAWQGVPRRWRQVIE